MTRDTRGDVRGVFVFALLAALAVLSLVIVVVGARAYRSIDRTAETVHTFRTGMSYLIGKVRGADEEGMLEVRSSGEYDMLVLGSVLDDTRYNTYIYFQDGAICEYFAAADRAFDAGYGEEIIPVEALSFTLKDRLLTIALTDDAGTEHVSSVFLTAGGEAEP
mgnify:CR=1 FL=1